MCYDAKYLTRRAAKYAETHGEEKDWEKLKKKIPVTHHVSGFSEPDVPAIIKDGSITGMTWHPYAFAPNRNTLNARDDNLFTKWKSDFQQRRGLVIFDGFYDSHSLNGIKYPIYVEMIDQRPLAVGAIYRTSNFNGELRETISLITTRANKEMAYIHNEPAYSPSSRMMLVIEPKDFDFWLNGDAEQVYEKLNKPLPDNVLTYHPCYPIKSNKKLNRSYPGNVETISQEFQYPGMAFDKKERKLKPINIQTSLF